MWWGLFHHSNSKSDYLMNGWSLHIKCERILRIETFSIICILYIRMMDVFMTGFHYRFLMQGCEGLKARISKWQPLFLPHDAENYSSAIRSWDWKYSVLMKNTYNVLFWSSYTLRRSLRRPRMSVIHTNYAYDVPTSNALQRLAFKWTFTCRRPSDGF